MLFFYNRLLLTAIAALALIQLTVALPLPLSEDNALVERSEASNDKHLYLYPRSPRPANKAKITLHPNARKELDDMGLHGKQRRNMIKWHKNQIKTEMHSNPALHKAVTAQIQHIAHEGGSNPHEKSHITTRFSEKGSKVIPNSHNNGKNHHVYTTNTHGLWPNVKGAMDKANAGILANHQKKVKAAVNAAILAKGK